MPETQEYGVSSFVHRARRPFHPEKFNAFLARTWPGLVRAKGLFWLVTRPRRVGEMSLAGAICRTGSIGQWWAAVPHEHWPTQEDWRSWLRSHWTPGYGDLRQELVFIGVNMYEATIRSALDDRLVGPLKPTLFDPEMLKHLPDPFPAWGNVQG